MASSSLKSKTVSGLFWMAIQRYSKMFIQFVSGIILARMLTPYDYGCIGMVMVFVSLSEVFIDGGFGSALIQKKRPDETDYSTVFYWNLCVAVISYFILFACAPWISRLYRIPELGVVLRVQGVVLFVYAFNVVQRNQLKKRMNFKLLSMVTVSSSVIALLITILMAYNGYGVWSLVVQNFVVNLIPTVLFWFLLKWRPLLRLSWASFRELFSFGFYMFMTSMAESFSRQVTSLMIGRVYNADTLGYYSKALGTERLASYSITRILTQVTYPLYAEIQNEREKLVSIIRQLVMIVSFLTFPLMSVLMLNARPLFMLLYSDRWLASAPYFQVLCVAGFAACLQAVNYQSVLAVGKSRDMFYWTLVKRFVGLAAMVVGLLVWGMKGLLVGVVINAWFSYFVNIGMVSFYVGYKWIQQLKDLLAVTLITIISLICSYLSGLVTQFSLYWDAVLKTLVFSCVYFVLSFALRTEAWRMVVSLLKTGFKKRNRS